MSKTLARRRLPPILFPFLIGVLLLATFMLALQPAGASSHREAPLISKDQFADNTDVYAFLSPQNSDNIVLVANWIPFEAPEGGPNYYEWDDNVLYDIYVDNNGDARPNVTYTLSSNTVVQNSESFLYNVGPIDANGTNLNRSQTYTLTETTETITKTLLADVPGPPVNIGSKSTPNYDALDDNFVYTISDNGDDIQIFAGQRDDPFWVDLQIFDLLTLRGQQPPVGYSTSTNVPIDSLSGFNVHSLVIELPIDRLTQGNEPVLGVWAAARRPATRVLNGPAGLGSQTNSGPPVQVSRLGMPLTNEVVLPYALKDAFNAITPYDDVNIYLDPTLGNIMQNAVEDPEVGRLLCALYGIPLPYDMDGNCSTDRQDNVPLSGRADLFQIFLTGMVLQDDFIIQTGGGPQTLPAGYNINQPNLVQPADMIRINTNLTGTLCSPTPNRLGVLGGDACGFPNGRRLADDVINIELLAVAGATYQILDGRDTSFSFDPNLINILDDGLNGNDKSFLNEFPYLAAPHAGDTHAHQNTIFSTALPVIMNAAQTTQSAVQEEPLTAAAVSFGGGSALLGLFSLFRRRRDDEDLELSDAETQADQ